MIFQYLSGDFTSWPTGDSAKDSSPTKPNIKFSLCGGGWNFGGVVFPDGGGNGRKEASVSELANDVMRPERPESLVRKSPPPIYSFFMKNVDIGFRAKDSALAGISDKRRNSQWLGMRQWFPLSLYFSKLEVSIIARWQQNQHNQDNEDGMRY